MCHETSRSDALPRWAARRLMGRQPETKGSAAVLSVVSSAYPGNPSGFRVRLRSLQEPHSALIQCISTSISLFGLVTNNVSQGVLDNFAGEVRHVSSPVSEAGAKTMHRDVFKLHSPQDHRHRHVRERLTASLSRKDARGGLSLSMINYSAASAVLAPTATIRPTANSYFEPCGLSFWFHRLTRLVTAPPVAVRPPSTTNCPPVVFEARSEQRKSTMLAISSTVV